MSKQLLNSLVEIQKELSHYKFEKGEITGNLFLKEEHLAKLKILAESEIIEKFVVVDSKTVPIDKIILTEGLIIPLTIYSKNLSGSKYFDSIIDFIAFNQYSLPNELFYLNQFEYYSDSHITVAELKKVIDIHRFIKLLIDISDYVIEEPDNSKYLIIFQKRKLVIPTTYKQNHLRMITYLDDLEKQFTIAHDREERITIFKSELVSTLYDTSENERFFKFLSMLDTIYDNYLKSHLLYLEKFSYHDLKSEVDEDKLDFTKKIYSTVNDIQTKLIAVPAAFLLVLSQFDFTGVQNMKNILICIGSLLFSVLLEVLLGNQFGVLKYIESEITNFKNELSNKDTKIDLSEFIKSFADLQPLIKIQRNYLWVFRVVVWLISVVSILMYFYFRK